MTDDPKSPLDAWCRRRNVRSMWVALDLGITWQHVNCIRRGTKKPTLELAQKIERLTRGQVPVTAWGDDAA